MNAREEPRGEKPVTVHARIPKSDDELLAECNIDTFSSSGPGGQNVNRRATAVRLRHRPTGLVVTCQQERSQHRNKHLAVQQLRLKLSQRAHRPRRRVPTAMPRHVRTRILDQKKYQARKKRLRERPTGEE